MTPDSARQATPAISVVISTRDRAGLLRRCVASVLGNRHPSFEVIVIDQSRGGEAEAALGGLIDDPRLRFLRSNTRGLSTGRNEGVRAARGQWIACTDDDCETPDDWLDRAAAALQREERPGVVFGNVRPAPYDHAAGFVPGLVFPKASFRRHQSHRCAGDGMSACVAFRREVWERLGGFDEMLGAGSRFRAAEDMDFAFRALQAGLTIFVTPDVEVVHHGFRDWQEGRSLIYGYLYGIGAMSAKHLKCRRWSIAGFLAELLRRWVFSAAVVEFGHTPSRSLRLQGFLAGAAAGFAQGVDRPRCLFHNA